MLNLLLLLFFGMLLSFAIDKDFEDVFPPFVFTLLIGLYCIAIMKKSHHAFFLSLFAFAAIWIFYIIRKQRILPSFTDIKEKFRPLPLGFICYIAVCILMMYCYHNHFVLGWDDFHYNATFPRDMYYYGTMPVGSNSTTGYKDYLPLMQLFYYWGFQGIRAFSEPLMFQYKMILIYTCMLPFFKLTNTAKGIKKAFIFILALILPYISLIELTDGLSMDAAMALLFAYSITIIVFEKKRDWFCYYRILIALLALTLIKSIAALFVGICIGVWFITELFELKKLIKKERLVRIGIFIGSCLAIGCAFLSWKIFCIRNGNSTYLSQKLFENEGASTGIQLPSYGISTLQSIMKSLFTMRLNFGVLGLTVIGTVLIVLVLCLIMARHKLFSKKELWCYIILFLGLVFYIAFLCYTYLFIFEPWEAHSLSSLDRYLGTYVLTMMFFALYHYLSLNIQSNTGTYIITGALLITLNYPMLYKALAPSAYMEARKNAYETRMSVEKEIESLNHLELEMHTMLIVNNTEDDMYSRSMQYGMIPIVTEPFSTANYDSSEVIDALIDKIIDRNIYYVYFTEQLGTDPNFAVFNAIVENGLAESHVIYYYDAESGKLKLVSNQK